MKIHDKETINNRETLKELRTRIDTLTRSMSAVNARLAAIDPGAGDIGGIRRKVLDLDLRIGAIERGDSLAGLLVAKPYSE